MSGRPVTVRVTYEGLFRRVVAADDARAPYFLAWQKMRDVEDVFDVNLDVREDVVPGVLLGFLSFDGKVTGEGKGATVLEAVHDALSRGLIPQDALPHELTLEVVGDGGVADGEAEAVAAGTPDPSGEKGDPMPGTSPAQGRLVADSMAAMERAGLLDGARVVELLAEAESLEQARPADQAHTLRRVGTWRRRGGSRRARGTRTSGSAGEREGDDVAPSDLAVGPGLKGDGR